MRETAIDCRQATRLYFILETVLAALRTVTGPRYAMRRNYSVADARIAEKKDRDPMPHHQHLYAVDSAATAPAPRKESPAASRPDLVPLPPPTPAPAPRKRTRWPDDIDVVFEKDPAARNVLEVLTYQGLHAILLHRLAHKLYCWHIPVIPRLISQVGRLITAGIEIHPGARIGKRFFIDHGTGVVIGETADIGDNVMLYHQVTLGATGWWKHRENGKAKRHPTIGDNVTIGVGASILGPITIGHDSKIGAMALVVENLPPHSVVVAQPAKLLGRHGDKRELEDLGDEIPPDYVI